MNLIPFAVLSGVSALAVAILALYRFQIARSQEDDQLHVMDQEAHLVPKQIAVARRLQVLDAWGKGLTVLAVLAGVAYGAAHAYRALLIQ